MIDMLTRCPQCSAAFRLTPEQFSAAQGMVRCGSCLHVFKADEHWVHPAKAGAAEDDAATEESSKSSGGFKFDQSAIDNQTADEFMDKTAKVDLKSQPEEDGGIDDIDDDDEDRRYGDDDGKQEATRDDDPEPEDDFANLEDLLADDDEVGIDDDEEEEDDADEEWAQSLLDDLDDAPPASLKTGDNPKTPADDSLDDEPSLDYDDGSLDDDESLDDESLDEEESPVEYKAAAEETSDIDESNSLDDNGSLDDDSLDYEDALDDSGDIESFDDIASDLDDDSLDDLDQESADSELMDKLLVNERVDARKDLGLDEDDEEDSSESRKLLSGIEPDPVELSWNYSPRDLLQPLIWFSASLLMALLLVAQLAYFNFEKFSKDDRYRPWYAQVCSVLGCRLPQQIDRDQIRTRNLVVRSHPAYKNVLVVDAILVNDANFPQPYPPLELFFNDEFKIPVASRRFAPSEYLSGDVSADSLMQVGVSIHISLEVMDPGEKAVGYLLNVSHYVPEE